MADFWFNPEYTLRRLPQMGTTSVLASMVFCCGQVTGTESKAQQTYKLLASYVGTSRTDMAVLEGVMQQRASITKCFSLLSLLTPSRNVCPMFRCWRLIVSILCSINSIEVMSVLNFRTPDLELSDTHVSETKRMVPIAFAQYVDPQFDMVCTIFNG